MSEPKRQISVWDGVAVVIGIVVGMGIFRAPSTVAGAAGSETVALLLWVLGGVVSLLGALTYAELAAAYPDKGGEYHFLRRAYGGPTAFVFGWARLTVIQTGTIAGAGFVIGDYLSAFAGLGAYSSAIYAAAAVVIVTLVNLLGLALSTRAQNALSALLVFCLVIMTALAVFAGAPQAASAEPLALPPAAAIGFAMIFVLLTFGGWNEAAYLSGEVKNPQRDLTRILFIGVAAVTVLYVAVNWAYLSVLGLDAVAKSQTVGAELAAAEFGAAGAAFVTLFVLAASLSTMNGTMFTGARSAYAVGRDFRALAPLGRWDETRSAPVTAILAQGAIALALVTLGALTMKDGKNAGFETMVAYTAPVFWLFFLMTGLAVIVLRFKEPNASRPFKTPLYPLPPILFAATAAWMLYSSVTYAGSQAFGLGVAIGLGVLVLGIVLAPFAGGAKTTKL
jgi:amino acid transporter